MSASATTSRAVAGDAGASSWGAWLGDFPRARRLDVSVHQVRYRKEFYTMLRSATLDLDATVSG